MEIAQPDNEADNQPCDMANGIDAGLKERHNHANDDDRQHDLAQLRECIFRIIDEGAERAENTENRSARSDMCEIWSAEEEGGDVCE